MMTMQHQDRKKRLSIRWKWAITLSLVFFSMYFIISTVLLMVVRSQLLRSERETSSRVLHTVVTEIDTRLKSETLLDVSNTLAGSENGEGRHPLVSYAIDTTGIGMRIYDHHDNTTYSSKHFDDIVLTQPQQELIEERLSNGKLVLVGTAPVHYADGSVAGYVQLVFLLGSYHSWVTTAVQLFLVLALASIVVCIVVGNILAYYFYLPIKYITTIMNEVEEDNLSRIRIEPNSTSRDELTDLSTGINDLLDRMDLYISQQKQFVEDVSHELRTPVAIVEGHLNLLNRWGKDDPTVLEESLAASINELGRMKILVQEMLDLSRAEQATIHYKNELTDVSAVVSQTYNNFKLIHPNFRFVFHNEIKWSEIWINMYRNHFEQILIILLDNAVKYSQDAKDIDITVSKNFGNVEIEVTDHGEGISSENMKKIFSRFYRVDKARSREKGGNGLGLSIAKELVEGYKGEIRVKSKLGWGSTFTLSIPIVTDHSLVQKYKQSQGDKSTK